MPNFFTRDGKQVYVPAEQAAQAWESGQVGLPKGRVNVVGPDGRAGTVPTENLGAALRKGWRVEEDNEQLERTHGDRDISAFAAGAARGATLGLSDMVLTKTGLVDPETLDKLQQANPVSSGVGEVVGAVGSSFIPAGGQVSLATKLLRGVSAPSRLVAKGGQKLAGGVEGELLKFLTDRGVNKALVKAGELSLGETAKTSIAKQALARTAAFSAAGAVEGSIYGVAQAIDEKTLGDPRTVGELLVAHVGPAAIAGGMAGGLFGGASALGSSALKKLSSVAGEKIGEASGFGAVLESFASKRAVKGLGGVQSQMDAIDDAGIAAIGRDLKQPRDVLGGESILANSIPETLKRIRTVRKQTGEQIGAALETLDKAGSSAGVPGLDAETVAQRIEKEILEPLKNQVGYKPIRGYINETIVEIRELGTLSLKEANQQKTRLQGLLEKEFSRVKRTALNDVKVDIERVFKESVDVRAGEIAAATDNQAVFDGFIANKALYGNLSKARDLARKGVHRMRDNRSVSLTDYLTGIGGAVAGVASGNIAPLVMAGAGVIGNKMAREHGNLLLAKAADKAAKLRLLQKRVEFTTDRVNTAIEGFVGKGAGKMRLASSYILSDITGKEDRKEATREFATKLHRYIGNPEALADNIAASLMGMEDTAPELSAAMAEKTAQIVSSLQQYAPLPSSDSLLQPEAAEWDVDEAVSARFASIAAAHLDPVSAIEEALAGAGDPIAIKVVKQHYPGLIESVTPRILESVALSKKKLTWRDKVALSILLDAPVDPLLTPAGIRRAQQVHAPPPPQGQGPQGMRLGAFDKAGELPGMFQTSFQKTESIGESA